MSALQKKIQELAFVALDKIHSITQSGKATDARLALAAIERVVSAVRDALARKITPAELEAKIEAEQKAISAHLDANRKILEAEAAKKFGTTP